MVTDREGHEGEAQPRSAAYRKSGRQGQAGFPFFAFYEGGGSGAAGASGNRRRRVDATHRSPLPAAAPTLPHTPVRHPPPHRCRRRLHRVRRQRRSAVEPRCLGARGDRVCGHPRTSLIVGLSYTSVRSVQVGAVPHATGFRKFSARLLGNCGTWKAFPPVNRRRGQHAAGLAGKEADMPRRGDPDAPCGRQAVLGVGARSVLAPCLGGRARRSRRRTGRCGGPARSPKRRLCR